MIRESLKELILSIITWMECKFSTEEPYNPLRMEVEYLRIELNKLRNYNAELVHHIMNLTSPRAIVDNDISEDAQPVNTSKYVPWHVKRAQLEADDRKKAIKVISTIPSTKTTEELENELLGESEELNSPKMKEN